MRTEGAVFAGESSGHYYFREFFSADSGILPFLYFLELLNQHQGPVSTLVEPLRTAFPVSGELNFKVQDVQAVLADVGQRFTGKIDRTDGLAVEDDHWRFHLHPSNTEPLLRLNVEAKDEQTCLLQTNAVVKVIHYHTGTPQNAV